ncbi:MAG: hypothetical protein NC093_03985 [Alistipes sp.]|nr:hypothetical protein [Alistipes sp.]
MTDTKYTMIGMTSAGKTCYIAAMYMKMSAGFDGFTLITDDTTRTKLERDILTLRSPIGQERFPTATNETTTRSYEFRLSYETKKIITFEMLDYAGGLLRTRENSYAQVKDSIAESSALYVFIDGKSFCDEDREERKENVYYDCAMTVTPLIQDFADTHDGNLPPIVFVVTKADLCKQYVSSEEITSTIKELFSPAFSEGTYSYICAVSLGDTISDDNYKGRFKPVNIHIPFFIGSYHEYFNRCVILKSDIEAGNADLAKEKRLANSGEANELRRWKIFRDEDYIKKCRERAKNAEEALKSNQAILDSTKDLFYKFGARLETESANFKSFIGGVEQSSFKAFKL